MTLKVFFVSGVLIFITCACSKSEGQSDSPTDTGEGKDSTSNIDDGSDTKTIHADSTGDSEDKKDTSTNTDADKDTVTATEAESDTDRDDEEETDPTSDTDTDSDSDSDSDADADVDTDVDSDSDADGDTYRETETLSDEGTQTNPDTGEERETDTNADTDSGDDTDEPFNTDSDSHDDTESFCSEQSFFIQYVPNKMMIALDMSGSMIRVDGQISDVKYFAVKAAIQGMLTNFADRFYFGFDTYPDYVDDDFCVVDAEPVRFDCGIDNEESIISWINEHPPENGRGDPLILEMKILMDDPTYAPNFTSDTLSGEPYLLIVSDGGDACGPDGVYDSSHNWAEELGETAHLLYESGIKTIVVGYADFAEPETLDAIAQNGGTTFDSHIPAIDQEALEAALETIAGTISSCSFEIDDPGPSSDLNKVNFYFNDVVVPFDDGCQTGTGWTWKDDTHTSMQFCDQACAELQAGNVTNVSAKFGCPVVIIV